jgi:hypothetical protein
VVAYIIDYTTDAIESPRALVHNDDPQQVISRADRHCEVDRADYAQLQRKRFLQIRPLSDYRSSYTAGAHCNPVNSALIFSRASSIDMR